MSKEKEYIKNTVILLIGKFSTQIVSFLLLPLFTYKLSADNYGYVDLLQTYISLIAPVVLLQLDSAIFRFLIDNRSNKNENKKIISTSFFCMIILLILIIGIVILINSIVKINYFYYIVLSIYALVISNYFMAIARGKGNNKIYSIASILGSISNLIINVVLIMILKMDAKSILVASIISNLISSIYVFLKEKIYLDIKICECNFNYLRKMLKYSIPMIPNVLSWWIVGLSDRTIIVKFLSTAANGIYSVSCKFSNLLNSIYSIFNMSWQEMVSLHINAEDAHEFISKMMTNIFDLFVVASCIIIGIMPMIFNIVIGENYLEAYKYIPILLLGNIFNVLVGLLGGIYVAKKMTMKVATTTIWSAIINILINLIFIKQFGLYATCISTFFSYFIMAIYRYYDIRKYIEIKLQLKETIKYMVLFLIISVVYYFNLNIVSLIFTIIILIIYVKDNFRLIKETLNKVIKKIKRK